MKQLYSMRYDASVAASACYPLAWRDRLLRFSGFYCDVVTFGRNGRDAERWRLTGAAMAMNDVAIPGQSHGVYECLVYYVP